MPNPILEALAASAQETEAAQHPKQGSTCKQRTGTDVKRAAFEGEARSRRVQLLLKPSMHQKLVAFATERNISVNAAIELALKDLLCDQ